MQELLLKRQDSFHRTYQRMNNSFHQSSFLFFQFHLQENYHSKIYRLFCEIFFRKNKLFYSLHFIALCCVSKKNIFFYISQKHSSAAKILPHCYFELSTILECFNFAHRKQVKIETIGEKDSVQNRKNICFTTL